MNDDPDVSAAALLELLERVTVPSPAPSRRAGPDSPADAAAPGGKGDALDSGGGATRLAMTLQVDLARYTAALRTLGSVRHTSLNEFLG